jgi:aspartyl-tRNA(Asn)/glutamyl-tRNA(Gln) amidotransferase subunit B
MAPDDDPVITVVRLGLEPYVDAVVAAGGDAGLAVRRLANEVAAQVDTVDRLTPSAFVSLIAMEHDGALTTAQAREVLRELLESGGDPKAIAADRGFEALGTDALEAVVDQVVADHPDEWARTGGKADLKAASALLRSRRG